GTIAYSTREFTLTNTPVARAWEFASDKEEWLFSNQVSGFTSSNGTLGGAIVGPSAEIFTSGNLGVPIGPASNQKVRIRLKNTSAATQAKFYWLRDDDLTWTTSKSKVFAINANSDWTEYLVDLSSVPGWRGVMHTFNLYPALGVSSGSFSVDYIHIEP
ncbi:MAG TPA: hypothetical protein VFQ61_14925, partial [Polyangiaceae bacterium]|nr:hypothetical protein [Polyangiaceae bacterium]